MSLFSRKKFLLANYFLSQRVLKTSRQKEFHNLESAQRIGIMFQSNEQQDQNIVKKFVSKLQKHNIEVDILGWIDDDTLPDYSIGQQILYFCRKDVNWWGKPQNTDVDKFVQTKYDILFDLSWEKTPALCYVSHLSQAACKVGYYSSENKQLDLMFNTEEPFSMEQLMEHSISYLTLIKKSN